MSFPIRRAGVSAIALAIALATPVLRKARSRHPPRPRLRARRARRPPPRPRRCARRSRASRSTTAAGRGAARSPRADRHPDDLVQGGLRRRAEGRVGHRPLPRTPDVQGHEDPQTGRVLGRRRRDRRRGERLHLLRLHRLLPAGAGRVPEGDDGLRGRPDGEPRPHRRGGAARARRDPRRAPHAHRQRAGRPALGGRRRGAVPEPSLRHAGDRLAQRDGEAVEGRRHRLLRPLLHAEQRDPPDRGRRDARPGEGVCAGDLRQGAAPGRSRRAPAPAGARAAGRAQRHLERRARDAAERPDDLARALRQQRQARRVRGARSPRRHSRRRHDEPSLPRAGGRPGDRGGHRRLLPGHRARRRPVHDLRHAARGPRSTRSRSR